MRGISRLTAGAVGALVVFGCAACAGGSAAPRAAASAAPRFTAALAPGFSAQPTWSDTVTWTVTPSAGSPTDPDQLLMALQAESGAFQPVGSSAVALMFARGQIGAGDSAGLQFRSLATGFLLKTVHLPPGTVAAVTADTSEGRAVAVVHYTSAAPADEQANGGQPLKITSVYGADGSLVWTSSGRAVATGPASSSGLETGGDGYPIFSAGYALRYNGTAGSDASGQSYDVLDTAGAVVLHVPRQADAAGDLAHVSLAGGYALVSSDDQNAAATSSAIEVAMSAYDLRRHAALVGAWSEPGTSADGEQGTLLAAAGGRLLVDWLGPTETLNAPTSFAVLDAATGRAATVNGVPGSAPALDSLGAVTDPATGDALVYDAGQMSGPSFLIRLAGPAVAWAQQSGQASLLPISVHDGTIYGLQFGRAGAPLTLESVRESDGAITASGYQIAPVAFTDTGAAIFAQATSSAALTAVRIGLSPPSSGSR